MEIVLIVFAFIFLLLGFLGTFIPGLPGPPLSYIGLLFLQWSGRGEFTIVFLIVWAAVTIAVTIADYILPSVMTKRFGGSKAASIGSLLGLIAGIFVFPPWGLLAGPFLGAFAGELIHSRNKGGAPGKKTEHALKVAFGAFISFFIGTGIKLITCSVMLFYAVKAVF